MNTGEEHKIVERAYKTIAQTSHEYFHYWEKHVFLHWSWWLSLVLTVLPWAIWWKWRDKERTALFMFTAFFIIIACSWLEFIGVSLGLWYYSGKVIPAIPSYLPWDLCLIPVTMTLLMQIRPYISPFKKAIFYGALTAFIGEPLFTWIGLYIPVHWKHIYSFPIYVLIY
ncbi:CBO0543 family protein [Ectobacillus funiculus]|uniref:CBO0543 family protein n=1 Tax=Ectobacillus funiculus TaxID=137993 RepID=A0ABV5WFA5_9BACI